MNLSFWDTVRGNELADTLIRNLPKLAGREQICVRCKDVDEAVKIIEKAINEKRARFLAAVPLNDPRLIILERED